MLNPHHQSRYENTYISPGKYQHKGNKTDVFDRGCNCGHGVNHFRNYRYDSNGIYTPFGTVETNVAAGLDTLGIVIILKSGLNRCGNQKQHFRDNKPTWLFY